MNNKTQPTKNVAMSTKTMVMYALFTAIVVILQMLGSFIKLGPFSISLVLLPIVVGAAICGPVCGAWLGFVFSLLVLFSDSGAFLAVNVPGTIITVLAKGILSGLISGLAYKYISTKTHNLTAAAFSSAFVCPIVNTGLFLLGCRLFFMDTISAWSIAAGYPNAGNYMIFVLVGGNFIFELLVNIVLSPVIVRLVDIRRK